MGHTTEAYAIQTRSSLCGADDLPLSNMFQRCKVLDIANADRCQLGGVLSTVMNLLLVRDWQPFLLYLEIIFGFKCWQLPIYAFKS